MEKTTHGSELEIKVTGEIVTGNDAKIVKADVASTHGLSPMLKTIARWLLAVAFILAGWNHFRDPPFYVAMIPPWLPRPELLNAISGVAEMAGGFGILIVPLRRVAAWGLIALLIAVFPANIHTAIDGLRGGGVAPWLLWARLPFQLVIIAWVHWTCLSLRPASGGH